MDGADLPVHHLRRSADPRAEAGGEALMPEADPERRRRGEARVTEERGADAKCAAEQG